MGNFKRDNRSGGRRNSGGFGGRNSGRPMHSAICSDCGQDCEVPFRPTGDKPVFCSDCFRNKGNANSKRSSERDSGRFSSGDKRMYQAVCSDCGQDCEVPFNPTGDKPVYCSQCFGQGKKNKSPDQANRQFEIINAKLDKILKALSPATEAPANEKKKVIPTESKPAPKAKTAKPRPQAAKKPSQAKKTASPKKVKMKPKKKK